MSGLGGFLNRNKMLIIIPTILAGEFYLWWKIQQQERFVPQHQRQEIFIRPLEYAKKLYNKESPSNDHRDEGKSV